MTTIYHTDISAGAAATASVLNAPLGQLDAKLNPTVASYADTADAATTVTTGGTIYAVASFEVSFTPAYTGQVFAVSVVCGQFYPSATGNTIFDLRIVDSVNATVQGNFIDAYHQAASASDYTSVSGLRYWTAGAGDVGVVRKAKVYVTHPTNATVVHLLYKSLQVEYR